ncbi:MAG: FAD-dependent oxidoreductase, partial [Clostridia bacterium]|nr:FAD-dependent oxidoreductase [Clostridia bacterium]
MRYYELAENICRCTECAAPDFEKTYDLIVAGLGSAGTFLALSAAREGLSVLGAERGNCCGGMSVQGVVNGYYNGYTGGSYMAIDNETNALNRKIYRPFYNNPDSKKHRMENELLAHGAELSFHSVVLGVYAENETVAGVRLLQDGIVHEYGCKFLSDSTSEGHVLRMLGVPGWVGRCTDGATAPFSSVRIFKKPDGSLNRTNDDSGYLNPYDDEAFSTAVLTAHGKHLADSDPESERFLYAAPQIGNREGMTFEGEQTLTLRDILDETTWENTLCCAYSDIDKHGVDRAFDDTLYQDWFVISNLSTVTFKIRIPLGALVPKGWKRLVAVSRCLGIDNYSSSAVRMNRDMYRLGEAAGVAVAQALHAGKDSVLDIPYAPLRTRVEELGCFDPQPNELRGFVQRPPEPLYVPVEWMTDWEEIAPALGTDRPGVAIWSCRRFGEKMKEPLAALLADGTVAQRGAAAIALGLLGDDRCIPALRELVKNRSEYHYLDSRRSNQMPSVIAICLLGRFKDAEIVPELLSILQPEEFEKPMYHVYLTPYYKLSIIKELNSVYFQHYSFAVVALA